MPKKRNDFIDDINPIADGQDKAQASQMGMPSLREVDAQVFGGAPVVAIPESGRQIVEPIALDRIKPDPAQPRQAIPLSIRKAAQAELGIPEWGVWHRVAQQLHGSPINLTALLRGEGEAAENDPLGIPLVDGFLDLVGLAATLYREGQTNAITVQSRGQFYEVETGERRYQAFKMLHEALGDAKFGKIKARVVDKADVWRQATENGARRPLNAIGMARQLALLLMDLYRGTDGISILPYGQMVQEGEINRKFYAQVANGKVFHVPRGTSERILQATGLKSRDQIYRYRALLDLSDELWQRADEEDWPEGRIREEVNRSKPYVSPIGDTSPQSVNQGIQSTHQKASPFRQVQDEIPAAGGVPIPPKRTGQFYLHFGRKVEMVQVAEDGLNARVNQLDSQDNPTYGMNVRVSNLKDLSAPYDPDAAQRAIMGDDEELPPTISTDIKMRAGIVPSSNISPAAPKIAVAQKWRNAQGRVFVIDGIRGEMASGHEINARTGARLPSGFNMTFNEVLKMTLIDEAPAPAEAEETAVSPEIYQHIVTGLLYRITGEIPGNWVRVVEVDVNGEIITGEIHAMKRIDLKPYHGEVDEEYQEALEQYVAPAPLPSHQEHPLPSWVYEGAFIQHTESQKPCEVKGWNFDARQQIWVLRVDVAGETAYAPLGDFEEKPNHESLLPKNMNGVITEMQHLMGRLGELARFLEMVEAKPMITGMQILTANNIKDLLAQAGGDVTAVQAHLDTQRAGAHTVADRTKATIDAIYFQHREVLADIHKQQRGQA